MLTLKPQEIPQCQDRVIDVRSPDEYAAERLIAPSECVPLGTLPAAASCWDRNQPLLLLCKGGVRARQAAEQLESMGFTRVSLVEGGLDACKKAGVGVVVNRGRIPLFRQVLMTAGLLLLIGLLLSWVHPLFIVLDWVVAVGLTMAGLTGFCPMAKLLERMPWNAVPASTGGTCCR